MTSTRHRDMLPPTGGFDDFAFTAENEAEARRLMAKYPPAWQGSAVLDVLRLAQDQVGGWVPPAVLAYVARFLGVPEIRVWEVATFYDMYNTDPVGRTQIRVCTTTPCMLAGSDEVVAACERTLGIKLGESTPDGRFFLRDFECLGACANAPMMWIDDDYFEDLDAKSTTAILDALKRGERPKPGSQRGRQGSMPIRGRTTLFEIAAGEKEHEEGPVDPATQPVDKGRPDERVKEHAVEVEEKGRPAEGEGEEKGPDITGGEGTTGVGGESASGKGTTGGGGGD